MKTQSITIALGIAALTLAATQYQRREISALKAGNQQLASRLESLAVEKNKYDAQSQELVSRQKASAKEEQWLNEALDKVVQGIKKAREEAMEPTTIWKDSVGYVDIPKRFLRSLRLSGYEVDEDGVQHISSNVAALLGMTRDERNHTQEAISRTRNAYHAKERAILEYKDTPLCEDGISDKYQNRISFRIPAYEEDSKSFQAQYKEDLKSILGETRASLVLKYAEDTRLNCSDYIDFTELGLYDRVITIGTDPSDSITNQWHFIDWGKNHYTLSGGMGIGDQPNYVPTGWKHLINPDLTVKP